MSFKGSHYLALYHFCTLDQKLDIKIWIMAFREWRNLSLRHGLWHLACITFPLLSSAPLGRSEYQFLSNKMTAVSADKGRSPVWYMYLLGLCCVHEKHLTVFFHFSPLLFQQMIKIRKYVRHIISVSSLFHHKEEQQRSKQTKITNLWLSLYLKKDLFLFSR